MDGAFFAIFGLFPVVVFQGRFHGFYQIEFVFVIEEMVGSLHFDQFNPPILQLSAPLRSDALIGATDDNRGRGLDGCHLRQDFLSGPTDIGEIGGGGGRVKLTKCQAKVVEPLPLASLERVFGALDVCQRFIGSWTLAEMGETDQNRGRY
ncbi:hypothetical protein [endosymbiont of Ridgeia piscesae]|jgi:hypothetical protein|uniref:hypothetical protein n=1 Tax=endosymbiont of Ridgeia piscesae TaxID=54398 RepID=UPI0018DFE43A|nr:hypothetical protein [endosymbiont of Ridgeia piscesae]